MVNENLQENENLEIFHGHMALIVANSRCDSRIPPTSVMFNRPHQIEATTKNQFLTDVAALTEEKPKTQMPKGVDCCNCTPSDSQRP